MTRGAIGQWALAGASVFLLAGCGSVPVAFHPASPIPPGEFSHRLFDEVLRTTVGDGIVDYPAVQKDERLTRYVAQLDRIDPSGLPRRQDRLAFWINAYNALAIQGILDGSSPATLAGRYRYFIGHDYRIGGERINLYDLERHLLIPGFREPRVHFAIVCASRSCPKLRAEAYLPDRLEEQLESSARAFINDAARNRFDRERKVASLSMIFKWFEEDFAGAAGSLLGYVARYVPDLQLAGELTSGAYTVEFLDYDWRLNGPPPQEVPHAGRP